MVSLFIYFVCTALLSPQLNLRLPSGVVVSPSYILGKNLSSHIGDHQLMLLCLKKSLKEHLVLLNHKACIMSHDLWGHLEQIMKMMIQLKEMAAEMDSKMMVEGMDQEGDMMMTMMQMEENWMNNMTQLWEHAYQLKVNFTMVKKELLAGCNFTNITNHVEHMLSMVLANYTCMMDGDMGEKDDIMVGFEQLIEKIGLKNMYELDDKMKIMMKIGMESWSDGQTGSGMDKGVDMEMDKMGGIESLLEDRGSMAGDFWGVLGNNDTMSTMMTDLMKMTMEGDDKLPNITTKKHMLVMKIKQIAAMLMMSKCNVTATLHEVGLEDMMEGSMDGGDMTMGGDTMGGASASGGTMGGAPTSGDAIAGNMTMGGDMTGNKTGGGMKEENLTEKQRMIVTAIDLLKKMAVGHHKWTIFPSPKDTNKIHFRVLDSQGPQHCDNVPRDFGMMVARGGSLLPPMELLRSELLRRKIFLMNKEGGEMTDMDMQRIEMNLKDFAMGMVPPFMTSMLGDEAFDDNAEDMLARMVDVMDNMTDSEEMMGGEGGMMGGDMTGDVTVMGGDMQISGQGSTERQPPEETNVYQSAEKDKLLMKLKEKEGRGVAKCLNELYTGKVLAVDGSNALIDQYSSQPDSHGFIMEYGSGEIPVIPNVACFYHLYLAIFVNLTTKSCL